MESDICLEQRVRHDKKLNNKFQMGQKIGEGCFGKIYKVVNRLTKASAALKIEMTEGNDYRRSSLAIQMSILEKLRGIQGVPRVYSSGKWQYGLYIEMELLGESLHDEKDRIFTVADVQAMTMELLNILKRIHARNIIHQDLKPQNIMRNGKGGLVIIDFGLSTILPPNCSSIVKQKKRGFIGTPRYASISAHKGLIQTPKDDIESLLYVMGFMMRKKAPWFQLRAPISDRLDKIQKLKEITSTQWFEQIGTNFATAYEYTRVAEPSEHVDYQYLLNLFQKNRKTLMSKPTQKKDRSQLRRKSDNLMNKKWVDAPIISDKTKDMWGEDGEGRENANFSVMAQAGCVEILQMLGKFLGEEESEETDAGCNMSEGMNVRDLSKYKGIDFKNPFGMPGNTLD